MNQSYSIQKTWAISLLMGGLLSVGVMTLFPYDFFFWEMVTQLTFQEIIELLKIPSSLNDIVLNSLLFIPFGFGLAGLLEYWRVSWVRSLLLILIASLGLSLTVEILQFFLPGRTSTPIDLLTNTLSGVSGGLLFNGFGNDCFTHCQRGVDWIKRFLSIPVLTIFFISYFILSCWLSIPLQNTDQFWSLDNWNADFPLILGNELSGGRLWKGKTDQFCLINKTASDQEISNILTSENPCDTLSQSQEILYAAMQPEFSQFSVNPLNQSLRQTSEFTLSIQLATAHSHQIGPARILSISKDFFERNLTVGQWRSHLSIRLRTPITEKNGTRPEFIIPNVFSDLKTRTLLLIYSPDQIQVYIDNPNQSYTLKITPEMTLFWLLSPVDKGGLHLNVWNSRFYKFLYYCLIFCPLGGCVGLILKQIRGKPSFYLLFVISGMILPSILLEVLLSLESARMISWSNLLLSLSITMIACYLSYKIGKNRMKAR
jgi:glycopeptide antibiotics resistance protein